ncbi:MAG: [acyl-carrier-protein] S-malonyltransferase [Flavobacteriaceae bacterium]|nr:[acyl-carrier-protein] S-malonyltransferase [Flavobacteriaceae bacterium]
MKAYIFPGQGSQHREMGYDLYKKYDFLKDFFSVSNEILGFNISQLMFEGSDDELKQTKVTQPAIFIHSVAMIKVLGKSFKPDMVAGHSLGEFSALVGCKVLSFEDGLKLVSERALAMQEACEKTDGTMAAVLGLENAIVEQTCDDIKGTVVPANYNCPGQIVISGETKSVTDCCEKLKNQGARRAIILPVSGAFHSSLMESAKVKLTDAIKQIDFNEPICPIYQNVSGKPEVKADIIKSNLISQLTSSVKWTQSVENMIHQGAKEFFEIGPGNVLQGLVKKISRDTLTGKPSV